MSGILFCFNYGLSEFFHKGLEFVQLPNSLFRSKSQITDGKRQVYAKVTSPRSSRAGFGFDQPALGFGVFDLIHFAHSLTEFDY